ncbi:MAG: hypothetical protein LBI03_10410 [Clostridiales bacterium]|jgi:hypothetical protein|nr:hypothetical protein [Clostridiales bacterium]
MKKTSLTAFGGIITALSVLIMFLSGVLPFLTYTLPAFAGALLIIVIEESDIKWSLMVYVSVSLLSLILIPNKESAILYLFFFGYCAVLQSFLEEKFKSNLIRWSIKIPVFNLAIITAYMLIINVLGIQVDEFNEYGKYGVFILLGIGNLTYIIYDNTLKNLTVLYNRHLHKKMR